MLYITHCVLFAQPFHILSNQEIPGFTVGFRYSHLQFKEKCSSFYYLGVQKVSERDRISRTEKKKNLISAGVILSENENCSSGYDTRDTEKLQIEYFNPPQC